MKRLYVGCRVRVVALFTKNTAATVGLEGRVNELDCKNRLGRPGFVGVTIGSDDSWCFHPDKLEPIQDPGHQVVEWSECLWQPEGIAA